MTSDRTNSRPWSNILILTSLLVPLACIPYIPIRRHLISLKRSLTDNSTGLHRELSNALLATQLRKEESLKLAEQLRDVRAQLHTVAERAAECNNARLSFERDMSGHFRGILARVEETGAARAKADETLRRQLVLMQDQIARERVPPEVLQDLAISLGDTAAFLEEVEILLGWSHSIPRDRGIDRMRQLALRLHATAENMQSHSNSSQ